MTQLEELKKHTILVSDTGDVNEVKRLKPQDATTNPSLIYKAAKMDAYKDLVDQAIKYGKGDLGLVMVGGDCCVIVMVGRWVDPGSRPVFSSNPVGPAMTHSTRLQFLIPLLTLSSFSRVDSYYCDELHRINWPSPLVPRFTSWFPVTFRRRLTLAFRLTRRPRLPRLAKSLNCTRKLAWTSRPF
mmetsp:Transcript_7486/g.16560  ORF Transcript_7486/g.16560 Transcript_7486/m.16560 type:complete len:185 (-) Transcript_7486:752-1306(-)